MFDHIGLKVEDLDVSARFYKAVLLDPDGNNVEAVCLGEEK
jgi:hypothetical protein